MQISKMRDFQAERGGRGDLVIKKRGKCCLFFIKRGNNDITYLLIDK